MNNWNYEEYLNEQIEEIEELKRKGGTEREILDRNKFDLVALKLCGLKSSYLTPQQESKRMTFQEWETHTSIEQKWEFDGTPFCSEYERDRVLLGLLYSSGLKHLLDILPEESKKELVKLIYEMEWSKKKYPNKRIVFYSLEQYEEDNKLVIEDIEIIEIFEDINDAFKCYRMLHRRNKVRELSFGNTKDELLVYENKRIRLTYQ